MLKIHNCESLFLMLAREFVNTKFHFMLLKQGTRSFFEISFTELTIQEKR